jgi:hypothetical protein
VKFHLRNSIDVGLIRLNFAQGRYTSTTIRLFLWFSWNSRTGWKWNPPGPGWFSFGAKPRRNR